MFENKVVSQLKELNLSPETKVSLLYSGGCSCYVHNESEVETALAETDVINVFTSLVSKPGLNFTDNYGNNIIDSLVNDEWIERDFVDACWDEGNEDSDDSELADTLSKVFNDEFSEQGFIEKDVTQYDYKRGFVELTARLNTTVGRILNSNVSLAGWKVSVPMKGGTFTLNS
jgi:hypothetical protein